MRGGSSLSGVASQGVGLFGAALVLLLAAAPAAADGTGSPAGVYTGTATLTFSMEGSESTQAEPTATSRMVECDERGCFLLEWPYADHAADPVRIPVIPGGSSEYVIAPYGDECSSILRAYQDPGTPVAFGEAEFFDPGSTITVEFSDGVLRVTEQEPPSKVIDCGWERPDGGTTWVTTSTLSEFVGTRAAAVTPDTAPVASGNCPAGYAEEVRADFIDWERSGGGTAGYRVQEVSPATLDLPAVSATLAAGSCLLRIDTCSGSDYQGALLASVGRPAFEQALRRDGFEIEIDAGDYQSWYKDGVVDEQTGWIISDQRFHIGLDAGTVGHPAFQRHFGPGDTPFTHFDTRDWKRHEELCPGIGWNTPSVLSSLPTVADALTPERSAVAGASAAVLTLLMAFPSRLVSQVRDRLLERLKAWWSRRRAATAAAAGRPPAAPRAPKPVLRYGGWLAAVLGLLAASAISVFLDPRAGFDLGTLRLLLSVFLAFLIEVGLGWLLLIWMVSKSHPSAIAWFRFKPWLLLAVVAVVLFTRLTGLQPGIAFGAVAGVAFVAVLTGRDQARFTLVGLGHAFGVAILAWIGYSLLSAMVGTEAGGWLILLHETLAGLTVAGISLLPLVLIPVRGLPGHEIYGWNRWIWGGSYLLGVAAFLLVLLPLPTSWGETAMPFWAWLGLFLAYAAGAATLWLAVFKPWRSPAEAEAIHPPTVPAPPAPQLPSSTT